MRTDEQRRAILRRQALTHRVEVLSAERTGIRAAISDAMRIKTGIERRIAVDALKRRYQAMESDWREASAQLTHARHAESS